MRIRSTDTWQMISFHVSRRCQIKFDADELSSEKLKNKTKLDFCFILFFEVSKSLSFWVAIVNWRNREKNHSSNSSNGFQEWWWEAGLKETHGTFAPVCDYESSFKKRVESIKRNFYIATVCCAGLEVLPSEGGNEVTQEKEKEKTKTK